MGTHGIHIIEADVILNGRRNAVFVERDRDDTDWETTVRDIMSGQVENVRHVWRAEEDINWFEEVSEDVAGEILSRLDREPIGGLLDFLEEHLGIERVADFCRELEAA